MTGSAQWEGWGKVSDSDNTVNCILGEKQAKGAVNIKELGQAPA